MNSYNGNDNETGISPRWAGFRTIWLIIALLLFLYLLISWLLGYGPNGTKCKVEPTLITKTVEVEKLITAPDTMAPHISLNNLSELHVATGTEFIDQGVSALDNLDGDVKVTVAGKVDSNTPGKYQLIYTATDAAGNSSSETRTVIVEDKVIADTTGPSITLNGQSPVILSAGSAFTDEGAKAIDTVDGDVNVTVTGKVDANTAGKYQLIYTSTDKAGNSTSETRTVVVQAKKMIDDQAPSISLNGESRITLPFGAIYTDAGAKAQDEIEGDISVTVTGNVDTKTPGQYPLIYTATDTAGNSSSKTRTIIIQANKVAADILAPMLTLNGASQVSIPVGTSFVDEGSKAEDGVDGDINVTVTGKVDTGTAGQYPLIYTATDSAGNSISRTRMVVVEAAKPIAMSLPETAKLYFGLGSSKFPQDTKLSLAAVIAYLHKNNEAKAIITGFHDASGNVSWNKRLSNKRAGTVSRLLQKAAIGADRIIIVKPAETTGTGLPKEARRVEVNIR